VPVPGRLLGQHRSDDLSFVSPRFALETSELPLDDLPIARLHRSAAAAAAALTTRVAVSSPVRAPAVRGHGGPLAVTTAVAAVIRRAADTIADVIGRGHALHDNIEIGEALALTLAVTSSAIEGRVALVYCLQHGSQGADRVGLRCPRLPITVVGRLPSSLRR
jgi:hypothetical protein